MQQHCFFWSRVMSLKASVNSYNHHPDQDTDSVSLIFLHSSALSFTPLSLVALVTQHLTAPDHHRFVALRFPQIESQVICNTLQLNITSLIFIQVVIWISHLLVFIFELPSILWLFPLTH